LGPGGTICIIDTGINTSPPVTDLSGKIIGTFDAIQGDPGPERALFGHGTWCATAAAALTNNGFATAAPAEKANIYAILAGDENGFFNSDLVNALNQAHNSGQHIVSMSLNGTPPYTLANADYNAVLHTYFRQIYNNGGLLFNAAGNDG